MLQDIPGFEKVPPRPGPNCYLKIDEYGGAYWHCPDAQSRMHLALALVFNFGTLAFFAWVIWHSL
jgi:hypothetical protein